MVNSLLVRWEETMQANLGDNSNSLSLAIDARMAIKALHELQRGGEANEQLRTAVEDVVVSLRALNSGDPLFANLSPLSSFESYEQIRTLQEVRSEFNEDVSAQLDLVTKQGDPERKRQGIAFAIVFFTALERRARQKFNQSEGFGI
jgi:hypothetical protein